MPAPDPMTHANADNLRSSFRNTKPPQQGDSVYGSIGFRYAADLR